MQLEHFFNYIDSCPLCNTSTSLALIKFKVIQLSWKIDIVECQSCGILFKKYFPNTGTLSAIYSNYSQHLEKPVNDKIFSSRLSRMGVVKGRHLDFGCGDGSFVHASLNFGWDSYGCDPFLPKRLLTDPNLRHRFFISDLLRSDLGLSDIGKFDCISMWAVAEHLDNPGQVFKVLISLLNPGGIIIFNAPYGKSLIAKFSGKSWLMAILGEHLIFFTKNAVKYISIINNVRIRRIYISGSPFPFGRGGKLSQGFRINNDISNNYSVKLDSIRNSHYSIFNFLYIIKSFFYKLLINDNGSNLAANFSRFIIRFFRLGDHIEVIFIKDN